MVLDHLARLAGDGRVLGVGGAGFEQHDDRAIAQPVTSGSCQTGEWARIRRKLRHGIGPDGEADITELQPTAGSTCATRIIRAIPLPATLPPKCSCARG